MVIRNPGDLKSLICNLEKLLKKSNIQVKHQRIYELFAHSQTCRTDKELRCSLPVMVDVSEGANDILMKAIKNQIKLAGLNRSSIGNLIARASILTQPYPVVAMNNHHLRLKIHWRSGKISMPYLEHDINKISSSMAEVLMHSTSYELHAACISAHEFDHLLIELEPLVARVMEGYEYMGINENSKFTKSSLEALEEVDETIKSYNFEYGGVEPASPYALFFNWNYYAKIDGRVEEVEESDMYTMIIIEGMGVIDQNTTDRDLRKFVGSLLAEDLCLVNHDDLLLALVGMRDDCFNNYEESQSD